MAEIMTYLLPYRCMIFIHMALLWGRAGRAGRGGTGGDGGGAIMKWNKLGILIIKKIGERRERTDGEMLWKRLSFTVFISFHVIIFAQSKPLLCIHLYELPLSLGPPSLSLIRNYEGKTKKSDSSFCRGPLMISLKWLTALNSIGNLAQSKQIWSVLETVPGGSLGEGCNMRACKMGRGGYGGGC